MSGQEIDNKALHPTIFHEDWWLNTATNGAYQVAEVVNNGKIVGRMPYCVTKRHGMTWCDQPPLTYFLGPAIDDNNNNERANLSTRMEITHKLIAQLPKASFIQIKCHRDVQDVLAWQEDGFRTTVQFTHEIHPAPEDVLWSNHRRSRRQEITKAQARVDIAPLTDPDEFLRFYKTNIGAKGMTSNVDETMARKIITEAINRQRGYVLAAKDKNGILKAAVFNVWDSSSMYGLLTTRAPDADSGIVSALIWHAVRDAASRNLIFDFAGLATRGSITFYAGFGCVIRSRYVVTKMSLPVNLAYVLTRSFKNDPSFI